MNEPGDSFYFHVHDFHVSIFDCLHVVFVACGRISRCVQALKHRAKFPGEAVFGIFADISPAYKCVKIRRLDWGKLGCRSSSSSRTVWLNTVGTFGVSSAAYWWTRLFACVGRWVNRVLMTLLQMQIVYVDDLHIVTAGPQKFLVLWMILAAYEAIGTPFSFGSASLDITSPTRCGPPACQRSALSG